MSIELCRLSDNKLSVRRDGKELAIVGNRRAVTMDELRNAFEAVEAAAYEEGREAGHEAGMEEEVPGKW